MPHVLIAGKLHEAGLALLRGTDLTVTHVEDVSETAFLPHLPGADALVIRTQPLTAQAIASGNRLKIVSRHGVGYDAIDVPALSARGIPLCIVGDVNSVSVAEHCMMLILACAKRLVRSDASVRTAAWEWRNRLEAQEVAGKRLLIVGYGRIGRHLARLAEAFGMQIQAHDPFLQGQGWPEGNVSPAADLAESLAWADVVSVNLPKTGRPLLGADELALMRQGAIVINTARGGIVDETALAAALASGQIGAAGLDVFDTEPPQADNPLLRFDQVILTPHIAGLTAETAERMAVASVQNVLDFFAGRLDPALVVNAAALARP